MTTETKKSPGERAFDAFYNSEPSLPGNWVTTLPSTKKRWEDAARGVRARLPEAPKVYFYYVPSLHAPRDRLQVVRLTVKQTKRGPSYLTDDGSAVYSSAVYRTPRLAVKGYIKRHKSQASELARRAEGNLAAVTKAQALLKGLK